MTQLLTRKVGDGVSEGEGYLFFNTAAKMLFNVFC